MFIILFIYSLRRLGSLLLCLGDLEHGEEPVNALPEASACECRALLYYDLSALRPECLDFKPAAQFLARLARGDVPLVVHQQERNVSQAALPLGKELPKLVARHEESVGVRRIDNEDHSIDVVEVVLPQLRGLSPDVPECQVVPFVVDLLDVEADGGHSLFE